MARVTLTIDERLLAEARAATGETDCSRLVGLALESLLRERRRAARRILDLQGHGCWEGRLDRMRGALAPPTG